MNLNEIYIYCSKIGEKRSKHRILAKNSMTFLYNFSLLLYYFCYQSGFLQVEPLVASSIWFSNELCKVESFSKTLQLENSNLKTFWDFFRVMLLLFFLIFWKLILFFSISVWWVSEPKCGNNELKVLYFASKHTRLTWRRFSRPCGIGIKMEKKLIIFLI